ncbi:16S rRNA (adenine(1518)-N(6)/adenine(1519)-N(6))-dimethyltransferase RsmA [Gammaproteobacteria bacterium]|nr:16S rRNA (adenine(1518)-N(6)/adenine(1519)-N(6))-dimethyltransferase RsmA [Gammaproteobacteria bacterium]
MPRPKKSLGQNFLIDPLVIDRTIQHLNPLPSDNFLEIGPGRGAITEPLLNLVRKIDAVEIDEELVGGLKKFESHKNFTLHNTSILKFSPKEVPEEKIRVVGNLPYNLSTSILLWSFSYLNLFLDMHFMFQKEFGERLIAKNNTKNFGRTSVITQYLTKPQYCFSIESDSFSPRPKVDSVFIKFKPIIGRNLDDPIADKLQIITKIAFMHRRKMIGKALQKLVSEDKLVELNIDLKSRAENLSVDDYVKIAMAL